MYFYSILLLGQMLLFSHLTVEVLLNSYPHCPLKKAMFLEVVFFKNKILLDLSLQVGLRKSSALLSAGRKPLCPSHLRLSGCAIPLYASKCFKQEINEKSKC